MATPRLFVRSGTSLTFRVNWWPPGYRDERIDSTGYSAKLEIFRPPPAPRRLYVSAEEYRGDSPPPGTVLTLVQPGEWEVLIGRTITASLPAQTMVSMKLTNIVDPEEVVELFSALLTVSPEAVSRVALGD